MPKIAACVKIILKYRAWVVPIRLIGFRNRLVHGYLEVSAERLEEIILYRLDDFEQFITAIVRDVFAGRQQDSD